MSAALPSSSATHPLLRASGLGLTFAEGHAALGDVTFSLAAGEFVTLVGPSGCGKSTLLKLIAGLLRPTRGELEMPGDQPGNEVRTAFVFQDPRLLAWRSAAENVRLPLELANVARSVQEERIAETLALVGLTAQDAQKTPRMLSGGMRMRVSLARALATVPDLLLLDEPFGALDDILRQQLNEELLRLWRQQGWSAVFVTHNVSEAVFLGDRVLVMSPAPSRIAHEVKVPFSHPRTAELRARGEFAQLAGEVSALLREGAK